jgi:uncharacterized protein YcaQ
LLSLPVLKILTISKKEARRLAIHHGALNRNFPFGRGKNAVNKAIEYLGYTQIDTISVVARAHHHQLWSRVPNYKPSFLHELQKNKKIFEYWWHAAAYLPMQDYRYSLIWKQFFKDQKDGWPKADPALKRKVLERIDKEGPLMARDFKTEKSPKGGWWNWKPAKWALERLFLEGDLMVVARKGFQKRYDLTERALPGQIDNTMPSLEEYAANMIKKTLKTYGFARASEIAYLRNRMAEPVRKELKKMEDEGLVMKLRVKGLDHITYFTPVELMKNSGVRIPNKVRIISPFDPVIIQRKRINNLFDFDYQIECYVPRHKRKFGYFCLPVLYGDRFIGRMDAKADRKNQLFHINHLVLEDSVARNKIDPEDLQKELVNFMEFNGCDQVRIHKVSPSKWYSFIENLNLFH